jgi:hypothetical protein
VSSFVDLDKSIRAGYKILRWAREGLKGQACRQNKMWVLLARWINFEHWFSFEKAPNLEKIVAEPLGDVMKQIEEELTKYENGSL